ncbi:MAG: hypothetical protein UX02_C0001G0319 [Candidatus Moranbacteria bacterium GW2011_GWC1_45_18]|nr:MAG: hypothetical protein UT79_C0002G0078 [Candidatus Moranbacteria bacterium GW2011_GWC2_40_12]KKT33771.1 MAG: hypothetical protein UW19_C0005G0017 [Candidatus Moranbacteria bacterium GW2011_GWF2_44_10]KKT71446.1 MAG: hypothetical protein UW66_C0032G0004 [Candidatus Moranbacteria bacterium GW2011_GWF1_44_4]KKU00871.1 MAG: hypothetical protein UX02_C0001G0319 [Candidatus Moranbacteria bacterium GW2011_GWC1_45_18]OGI24003.1 MAG: hypothetical protein A2194_02845 [Candidatus Moranbacteria bacte
MPEKKKKMHLATITIFVSDRKGLSASVNRILTNNGRLIMARLGVNVQRHCVQNCLALIVVAAEGTAKEIDALAKELNKLKGIKAKTCFLV